MPAEADLGVGGVALLAELRGAEAEPVVGFIVRQSPTYPCRNVYFLFGPNSNTYAQWVLDSTGWNVQLPMTSIGTEVPPFALVPLMTSHARQCVDRPAPCRFGRAADTETDTRVGATRSRSQVSSPTRAALRQRSG